MPGKLPLSWKSVRGHNNRAAHQGDGKKKHTITCNICHQNQILNAGKRNEHTCTLSLTVTLTLTAYIETCHNCKATLTVCSYKIKVDSQGKR